MPMPLPFSFALGPADFDRFQTLLHRRLRRRPRARAAFLLMRMTVWCCAGLAVALWMRVLDDHPELPGLRLATTLVAAAVAVAGATTYASRLLARRHMLAANGAFLSPVTIEFTEQALVIRSATTRTEVAWQGLIDRDEDETNHYLFVDAMQAFILPRADVAPFAEVFERHTAHLRRS